MRKIMIWGLAVLIILIIGTAGVLFIRHQRSELADLERQAAETEKALASSDSLREANPSQRRSPAYKPPPPGETEDTGHWDGNVWHKTEPPKPQWKKGSDDDLYSVALREGYLEYAELKEALRYHPESPLLLSHFALEEMFSSPENAIVYAKKALRNLSTTSEDYSNMHNNVTDSPGPSAHWALGRAYQKLGDYKSALVHLKMTQSFVKAGLALDSLDGKSARRRYESCAEEIAAIKAGKPLLGPEPEPEPSGPLSIFSDKSTESSASVISSEQPVDVPPEPEFRVSDGDRTPSLEAEQPHAGTFMRQRQEFESFLRWMDQIESAKSPADLDNFLMREMAKQLQGESSQFDSDRLIRAFETLERHGETEGLRALEKRDAELARKLSREHPNPKNPPKPNNRMK